MEYTVVSAFRDLMTSLLDRARWSCGMISIIQWEQGTGGAGIEQSTCKARRGKHGFDYAVLGYIPRTLGHKTDAIIAT